jgi:hypothetical protein
MLKRFWKIPAVMMLGGAIWIAITPKPLLPIVPTLPILLGMVIGMIFME